MLAYRVRRDDYMLALGIARLVSDQVADATSAPEELPEEGVTWFLTRDANSGYGVTDNGTLIGLFSLVRGRGDSLVDQAVEAGARHLDCFDGYLPSLYARHGFRETHREDNWTPGGPAVIYMSR